MTNYRHGQMINLIDEMNSPLLAVEPQRCVLVRHRNGDCLRCAAVCTTGAISLGEEGIVVSPEKCIGCGTCASACPTGCLTAADPTDEELFGAVEAALAENENAAATESAVTRIRSCCRGCGKVECGVWVYVQDGKVIRTEGDADCFLTMGNHCSKGQASIQAAYHPDRIKYPMKRTNPKGDDDPGWVRISWDEAYPTIADNILEITAKYGNESTFTWCGTGRQWCMQSDAGMALLLFGTPNIVAAYQVCKGPRHFASRIDNVQAWSWSELINHSTKFVQWATEQSQSNYDDAARTVVDVARCADAFISVDPRQTNLGRTAKYWLPLRPGTDNALALGWCHLILKNDLCDWQFLKRWSNSPFIVVPDMDPTGYEEHVQNGGYPYAYQTRLLTEADIDPTMVDWEIEGDGDPQRYLVFDQLNNRWTYWQAHPEVGEAHWEGEDWQKSTSYFDQDLSRLRDDESKKPGKVYDLSEFNPLIDPAMYGEFDVKLKDGTTHKGRRRARHRGTRTPGRAGPQACRSRPTSSPSRDRPGRWRRARRSRGQAPGSTEDRSCTLPEGRRRARTG